MTEKDGSIDAAIGGRIRSLRLHQKLTQGKLGDKLGVSFQQVQTILTQSIAGSAGIP